ncbi:hypothetical protein GLOIN_2v1782277 [Rhizophagus irregularis DAOM 181602=DAOM 197198]|uniref:Uncharacterized protein n=1 Tax=Rhizophagus irregularis (strain DAOM 181602 / DAOM 197198 / MUCL 43194) TaxID=747089 RepID=A0A2P4PHZ3_RHIID|nr:hypothetical protein GLOIN_2v1782277 [Rhizophagus irregularis DAOM 181602=DAOM 197198]POG65002.1 hypothetical protein GLOIN_2v1782277 [Rhizophagus irregularis DAOM 181602=DAOM 197198]GBC53938.2 hypothetical protein GLOIN_2v1782277 [Rhizophagus irregularis DAOM 181602=DAOM 197198]|eukprot:XP_025171868.1 hypothetical protein GLOIN_2v1782277 [Rhizophagus irregularis DAOM 181602=DAOM 197198]
MSCREIVCRELLYANTILQQRCALEHWKLLETSNSSKFQSSNTIDIICKDNMNKKLLEYWKGLELEGLEDINRFLSAIPPPNIHSVQVYVSNTLLLLILSSKINNTAEKIFHLQYP